MANGQDRSGFGAFLSGVGIQQQNQQRALQQQIARARARAGQVEQAIALQGAGLQEVPQQPQGFLSRLIGQAPPTPQFEVTPEARQAAQLARRRVLAETEREETGARRDIIDLGIAQTQEKRDALTSALSDQKLQTEIIKARLANQPLAGSRLNDIFGGEDQNPFIGLDLTVDQTTAILADIQKTRNSLKVINISDQNINDFVKLKGLVTLANDVASNFDPSFVGPIEGRTLGLKRTSKLVRALTGVTKEKGKALTRFATSLSSIRNQLLNWRSGGAVTPEEAARLAEEIPEEIKTEEDFKEALRTFQTRYNELIESKLNILQTAGRRVTPELRSQLILQLAPIKGEKQGDDLVTVKQGGQTFRVPRSQLNKRNR